MDLHGADVMCSRKLSGTWCNIRNEAGKRAYVDKLEFRASKSEITTILSHKKLFLLSLNHYSSNG